MSRPPPLMNASSSPHFPPTMPTNSAPRPTGTLRRNKTLTRPERHVPAPLLPPPTLPLSFSNSPNPAIARAQGGGGSSCFPDIDWWTTTSLIFTFWAPSSLLSSVGGIKDKQSRQAWREKISLCAIALILGGLIGFATVGLDKVFCPDSASGEENVLPLNSNTTTLGIEGWHFDVSMATFTNKIQWQSLMTQLPGQDVTPYFTRTSGSFSACSGKTAAYASSNPCKSTIAADGTSTSSCTLGDISGTTFTALGITNTSQMVGYSWTQVDQMSGYMVLNGLVLNMNPYLLVNPTSISGDTVDAAIRQMVGSSNTTSGLSGKDATRLFYNRATTQDAVSCLTQRYLAGRIDKIPPGCVFSGLFLYASMVVILGVVLIRFIMAVVFNWFISARLVRPVSDKEFGRKRGVAHGVMPQGANIAKGSKNGSAPWSDGSPTKKGMNEKGGYGKGAARAISPDPMGGINPEPMISLSRIGAELFTVCLVTCYSEGEASIRSTLESIANTSYSDSRKLLFVICDGMVTGKGEKLSTPDICVGMLDADGRFGDPMPMGYIAVGHGNQRENRGMVYAGHYASNIGHRTPMVVIVKCGMPSEAKAAKPGNRGKRDSQLILMNFFSRVTYNDRMSPLDFDLFRKVWVLMGVTPDYFEVVLMVDADTRVAADSITHLVNCMHRDQRIMGVCGETRIANKRQSWVTMLQPAEYFIQHHLSKAFESVFGGVTCLPGCFSMYRLKVRRESDDDWIPILVKPDVISQYSQSDVNTLHQKNLLLLGEDRFLSTLMLRTFPKRRQIFCPQAKCHTVVPDTFSMLLSQRRRWINSTVHNLMELVRDRNQCGTFCFSMQFVVFLELVGTAVLPVAICLTYSLIINLSLNPPKDFQQSIPLILLCSVLGLPAILVLITTRKVVYLAWIVIYILALPIWNFVLPVVSFWQMDNFEWGATRQIQAAKEPTRPKAADKTAVFDGTSIPLRRWEDWERSRLRKIRREGKRRQEMEMLRQRDLQQQQYQGQRQLYQQGSSYGDWLEEPGKGRGMFGDDDAMSVTSSEDDVWGQDVGGYNEIDSAFPPPPAAFLPPESALSSLDGHNETLGMDQMQAMLEEGFEDNRSRKDPFSDNHAYPQPQAQRSGFGFSNSSNNTKYGVTSPMSPPTPGMGDLDHPLSKTSAYEMRAAGAGHAKKRSGGTSTNGPSYDQVRRGYKPL